MGSNRHCPRCHAVFRGPVGACPRDGERLVDDAADPLLGRIIADRYVIEAVIGQGGMGRVYAAHHRRVSRQFAIKILYGDLSTDPRMQTRFAREAEAASRLAHPNLVGVVDFGEDAGLLYLVMDYAHGSTLGELIKTGGPIETARATRFVYQLAEGLSHAHGRGLVHRDFKPDNIVVGFDDDGHEQARIVDFGIATFDHELGPDVGLPRLTTDGTVIGTPHYMAPEQATAGAIDHRVDLYALGVVLYEMLAGVLPFEGNAVAIARQHVAVEPPSIAARVPGLVVDPFLEDLALKLMAKSPDDRPASAREVVDLVTAGSPRAVWRPGDERSSDWGGTAVDGPGERIAADGLPLRAEAALIDEAIAAAPSPTGQVRLDDATATDGSITHDLGGQHRRLRRVIAALLVATLLAIAIVLVIRRDGGAADRRGVVAGIAEGRDPPAAVIAIVEVDAGVDAAPTDAAIEASPRERRDAGRRVVRTSADAGVGPAEEIPAARVSSLYRAVGAELNRAVELHGAERVESLRRRYLAIAITDAMHVSARRSAVIRDLNEVRAALRAL